MNNKKETLSTIKLAYSKDMYKIVDVLNRTLKDENFMFGLTLDEDNEEQAIFRIYRT